MQKGTLTSLPVGATPAKFTDVFAHESPLHDSLVLTVDLAMGLKLGPKGSMAKKGRVPRSTIFASGKG